MQFVEPLFHFAPDGGNGSLETFLLTLPVLFTFLGLDRRRILARLVRIARISEAKSQPLAHLK